MKSLTKQAKLFLRLALNVKKGKENKNLFEYDNTRNRKKG